MHKKKATGVLSRLYFVALRECGKEAKEKIIRSRESLREIHRRFLAEFRAAVCADLGMCDVQSSYSSL